MYQRGLWDFRVRSTECYSLRTVAHYFSDNAASIHVRGKVQLYRNKCLGIFFAAPSANRQLPVKNKATERKNVRVREMKEEKGNKRERCIFGPGNTCFCLKRWRFLNSLGQYQERPAQFGDFSTAEFFNQNKICWQSVAVQKEFPKNLNLPTICMQPLCYSYLQAVEQK